MRYVIVSNDAARREKWESRLDAWGYDVLDRYREGAVVVTLGGDGTILYAARNCADPTILPVLAGDSVGYRTQITEDALADALERIEDGRRGEDYVLDRHRRLAAYRDGEELRGEFDALNEISLHHSSPTLAAVFAVRIRDRGETREFERAIGDGVLVATPFGSTGYYRSITRGTFLQGIGVAFNNVHTPIDAPASVVLSEDAVVELELLASDHSSGAVLTRDNDDAMYDLDVDAPVEIRLTDRSVDVVRLPGMG